MSRLTDNDKTWGPFTLAQWKGSFSLLYIGADDEYNRGYNSIRLVMRGWALRIMLPRWVKPFSDRSGDHGKEYGFSLSKQGDCYDFLQVFYGPQTHDSRTTKSWSKFLPWTQKDMVRLTLFTPEGVRFAELGGLKWQIANELEKNCPRCYFKFTDYDGTEIIATCHIEEREWHHGTGWFKWLRFFKKSLIRRSLDLWFDKEVGPGKGSWKGGTIGTGTTMLNGDTPEDAFKRWCLCNHTHKGNNYQVRYLGPCNPPPPEKKKETPAAEEVVNSACQNGAPV